MKNKHFFVLAIIMVLTIPMLVFVPLAVNGNSVESLESYSTTITDFSDFEYKTNSPHVSSSKNDSAITFHYNGSSNDLERDVFIYAFEDDKNCSEYYIQFDVDYCYTNRNVFASFAPYFNSYYDEQGNLSNTTLAYIELQDAWTDEYGLFNLVTYPHDVIFSVKTLPETMGSQGSITLLVSRQNNETMFYIYNRTSASTIMEIWIVSGLSRPLNYIDLWFRGGYLNGNATITLSNISMNLNFTSLEIPSTYSTFPISVSLLIPLVVLIFLPIIRRKDEK